METDDSHLHFTLPGGRKVYVDAAYSYRTYMGSLEGRPPRKAITDAVRKRAVKMWGKRATAVVGSDRDDRDDLPPWVTFLWLQSSAMGDACGSELVVIYFHDYMRLPLDKIAAHALAGVSWDEHATDWWP